MENVSYLTSVKFNESVLVRLFVCKAFDISLAAHSGNCTRASHAAKGASAEYPKHVTCDKDCIYNIYICQMYVVWELMVTHTAIKHP